MALVSYDVSDASSSEEEDEAPKTISSADAVASTSKDSAIQDIIEDGSALFSVLPTPKSKQMVIDSTFSSRLLLNPLNNSMKNKKTVKISVPVLPDLEEEDLPRPTTRKLNPSKGSTLFDILPPPKNSSTSKKLIPDVLRKPPSKPVIKAPLPKLPKPPVVNIAPEEESDDDEPTTDFLGLTKIEQPIAPHQLIDLSPVGPESPEAEPETPEESSSYSTEEYIPFSQDGLLLDDEALQKLCGGSKRKRTNVQAQLIDVSESDVVPDKNEWMVKQLTEQGVTKRQSHKKHGGPSNQQKRKHQITYLAFQAKENEQELQNQWANNKMTKKQTQSKYGF